MPILEKKNEKVLTFGFQKWGEEYCPTRRKMGRPADSPKTTKFSVRFDEETIEILDEYCNQENVSRPEGVSRAVRKLKKQILNVNSKSSFIKYRATFSIY